MNDDVLVGAAAVAAGLAMGWALVTLTWEVARSRFGRPTPTNEGSIHSSDQSGKPPP